MNLYSDITQRSQPCYTRSPTNASAEETLNPEAFRTLAESYTGITGVAASAYVAITQIYVLIPAVCFYFTCGWVVSVLHRWLWNHFENHFPSRNHSLRITALQNDTFFGNLSQQPRPEDWCPARWMCHDCFKAINCSRLL